MHNNIKNYKFIHFHYGIINVRSKTMIADKHLQKTDCFLKFWEENLSLFFMISFRLSDQTSLNLKANKLCDLQKIFSFRLCIENSETLQIYLIVNLI